MTDAKNKNFKIFAGNTNIHLAKQVCEILNIPFGESKVTSFNDGEIQVEIHESVRGKDVYVIQSTCPPVNQSYMELFIILDALKRASAASITAVIPYYGYARQDRKVAPRAPITAKCMADLITTAGANRVVSVDLHAAQIQGFFNCPFDHLFGVPTLARAFKEAYGEGEEFVTVSPDAGGVERARAFSKRIGSTLAIIDKRRTAPGESKAMHLIGDVTGKTAVIVDDMIDTAGTLTQAVDSLLKNGAKQVFALATHAVLSGPAISRLIESPIAKVFVTDTIPLSEQAKNCSKIQVISVAGVLAEAIRRIHDHDSVSSLFD
ncbi:phosphoribosylpyrophosphate synthetase [Bdellovibrio sp. qaytius]|nr:phosphoribosylpyrophosphate synthetase [Bdellovibrio sp. qaytius]